MVVVKITGVINSEYLKKCLAHSNHYKILVIIII